MIKNDAKQNWQAGHMMHHMLFGKQGIMIASCSLASKAHGASLAIFHKFPSRSICEKSDLSGKPRTPEINRSRARFFKPLRVCCTSCGLVKCFLAPLVIKIKLYALNVLTNIILSHIIIVSDEGGCHEDSQRKIAFTP